MKATGKRLNKKCFKATDMGSDYSSGAHRSLLKYGDSMPLNPNLLPFLGILRVRKVAFERSTQPPEYIAHYRILRRLGKGGMTEVLLAEDTKQHGRRGNSLITADDTDLNRIFCPCHHCSKCARRSESSAGNDDSKRTISFVAGCRNASFSA